jgi:tellurite resistance protein
MLQELKNELSVIIAKTGIFFAKCDGYYDNREQKFISNFLSKLSENNVITDDAKEILENLGNVDIRLDDIIKDTNIFISKLGKQEQADFYHCMKDFIEGVINADNITHQKELENYEKWKNKIVMPAIS